jgi:hypothetical protein
MALAVDSFSVVIIKWKLRAGLEVAFGRKKSEFGVHTSTNIQLACMFLVNTKNDKT